MQSLYGDVNPHRRASALSDAHLEIFLLNSKTARYYRGAIEPLRENLVLCHFSVTPT